MIYFMREGIFICVSSLNIFSDFRTKIFMCEQIKCKISVGTWMVFKS